MDRSVIKEMYSEVAQEDVLVIKGTHSRIHMECSRCGKPLKTLYVIQSKETGVELFYLGAECYKHFA